MAVADTKVPLFKDLFLAFSDQNNISKKDLEVGQRPTTGHWFLLDYFPASIYDATIVSRRERNALTCFNEKV